MTQKISKKELKEIFNVKDFPLNDKGKYEGFWQDIGYGRKWFAPEDTYWWVEDLVVDILKKEKVFGDRQILLTRNLTPKDRSSLDIIFKGPISSIDLWMPGYGFAEIKYTGDNQRDVWGYDLNNKSAMNIYSAHSFSDIMKHSMWKNNKLFLIIVHNPGPGDKISISIIDLYDKFKFPNPMHATDGPSTRKPFSLNTHHININVSALDCLKRFDEVPFRKYEERCHSEKI